MFEILVDCTLDGLSEVFGFLVLRVSWYVVDGSVAP